MCDAATAVTLIVAAYSANEARKEGKRQERVQEVNARNLENDAQNVRNKGVEEENAHRLKVARLLSKQKAKFGAGGVDTNSGSASLILEDTKELGDADALRIRSNFIDQADGLDTRAGFARIRGDAARQSANAEANTTLIQAGGTAASKWYSTQQDPYAYGGNNDYAG